MSANGDTHSLDGTVNAALAHQHTGDDRNHRGGDPTAVSLTPSEKRSTDSQSRVQEEAPRLEETFAALQNQHQELPDLTTNGADHHLAALLSKWSRASQRLERHTLLLQSLLDGRDGELVRREIASVMVALPSSDSVIER